MVDGLPDMLDELAPSAPLAARAFAIASALAHPAFDCFYLALAERHGTRLVTADRRLVTRLAASQWAKLVVALGTATTS
jgi:predicted nucleic acid-binding protein